MELLIDKPLYVDVIFNGIGDGFAVVHTCRSTSFALLAPCYTIYAAMSQTSLRPLCTCQLLVVSQMVVNSIPEVQAEMGQKSTRD